ncbi:hypothetical protein PHPALM_30341 [Phytophthora palmivora]|uniref:Uncharacterized protein n=1 Tax=Phytophthora palmivora TaxID=4796 RepID=A0A2P4X5G7_9STRA|nr:hypothetical protein PHPALM_30341 [Phytophthora palmivora]
MRGVIGHKNAKLHRGDVINSTTVIPGKLWDRVSRHLDETYPAQAGGKLMVATSFALLKAQRLCLSESKERSFVRFNVFYDNNGKRQCIIEMGRPDMIGLLMYSGVSLFIDGAFSITSAPSQQALTVMGHDSTYNTYFPTRVLGKMKMIPGSITYDFEAELAKVVCDQFTEPCHIGCLFH